MSTGIDIDWPGAILRGIDHTLERQRQRRKLHCPYCSHTQEVGDDERLITFYGTDTLYDDEGVIVECHSCERNYKVTEMVERTYECAAIPGQAEETDESEDA
jgi:hypothetical protein